MWIKVRLGAGQRPQRRYRHYHLVRIQHGHKPDGLGTIVVTDATTEIVIDPWFSFNKLVIEGSAADGQGVRLVSATVSKTVLPEDQSSTLRSRRPTATATPRAPRR